MPRTMRPRNGADKYQGKFDQGGTVARGDLRPAEGAGRDPRGRGADAAGRAFPAWDEVPEKLKAHDAREMEVYGEYSENEDYNVGRVIDAIDEPRAGQHADDPDLG